MKRLLDGLVDSRVRLCSPSLSYLVLASILWALSFGLIRHYLVGLDASFVAFVRLGLSWLVFVPLLRPRGLSVRRCLALSSMGALQFGLMYVLYQESFRFLASYQVALFTVLTPLWVSVVHDLFVREFHPRFLAAAALAAAGTAWIVFEGLGSRTLVRGFLLVQLSNLCFAVGQVGYVRWMGGTKEGTKEGTTRRDRETFGWLYLGGMLTAGAAFAARGFPGVTMTVQQAVVLAYLGLIASGVGFFLWNVGARRVNAGVLAVANNLKIPLAMVSSLVLFGERAPLARLVTGSAVLALALWMNARRATRVR